MNSKSITQLLTNKYVLYATLFFAITNVLGYFTIQDFNSVILFILVGLLTSYFSKNMIVILLSAMITTNLVLTMNKTTEYFVEGNSNNNTKPKDKKPDKDKEQFEGVDDDAAVGGGGDINYDATLKESYGNLEKLLGGDGMNNLTKDTMQLMDRQKQLAESMKSLEPMLNNAKSMLKGFDMSQLNGLSDMVKSLGKGMGG